MTLRERREAIELLRCGADKWRAGLVMAAYALGHCDGIHPANRVYHIACNAYMQTSGAKSPWYHAYPRRHLLEAAARLEERSWP